MTAPMQPPINAMLKTTSKYFASAETARDHEPVRSSTISGTIDNKAAMVATVAENERKAAL